MFVDFRLDFLIQTYSKLQKHPKYVTLEMS